MSPTAGGSGGDLIDANGEVANRYGSMGTAYLIRPDGYVGFRCTLNDTPRYLPGHLAKLFAGRLIEPLLLKGGFALAWVAINQDKSLTTFTKMNQAGDNCL